MEPSLQKQLHDLPEGGSFEVKDDEGGTTTYIKPLRPEPCTEHTFVSSGPNEEQCSKCGNGRIYERTD